MINSVSHDILSGSHAFLVGNPLKFEIPLFPQEIWNEIIKYSKSSLVSIACASKSLNELSYAYAKNNPPDGCFGEKEWRKYGADQTVALPIPLKVIQDFDPSKWMLTWIPETINKEPLSFSSIDYFVSDYKNGKDLFKTNYRFSLISCKSVDKPIEPLKAHWILLSKDLLDGTRGESFVTQEKLVKKAGYEVPHLIDFVVSVLMNNLETGDYIFADGSISDYSSFSRVQEMVDDRYPIAFGGFSGHGLDHFVTDRFDDEMFGMASARTFSML